MPDSQFSPRYKIFCAMLLAARRDAGLSQQVVADQLGKPQSYVSKYESGERRIDVIELLAISEAIGFSVERFVRDLARA